MGRTASTPSEFITRKTLGHGKSSRSSVPTEAARRCASTSMRMPRVSQKVVAVMSAITTGTPGPDAAASCSPMLSALAISISAGRVTITGCASAPVTGSMPVMAITSEDLGKRSPEMDLKAEASQGVPWLTSQPSATVRPLSRLSRLREDHCHIPAPATCKAASRRVSAGSPHPRLPAYQLAVCRPLPPSG